ncbi:MAG: glycosyltransferase family 4 protein [Pseudomonadales bacterium]|nr:glycosyltransferase family 4 protein [Pseudomonadales bacterium]
MKILLISHTFLPKYVGGTEVYTFELATELKAQGHDVEILCTDPLSKKKAYSLTKKKYRGLNISVIEKNILKYENFEQTYFDTDVDDIFIKFIDDFNPDIIHYTHLMHLSLNLVSIASQRGIKQVATLNDFWMQTHLFNRVTSKGTLYKEFSREEDARELSDKLNSGPRKSTPLNFAYFLKNKDKVEYLKTVFKKVSRRVLGHSTEFLNLNKYLNLIDHRSDKVRETLSQLDLVIFPTVFLYQEFSKWGFQSKQVIISEHGIDTSLFKKFTKEPSKKIRFAFIGAIIPAKGLDILLKAWKKIDSSNVELKIYGKFDLDKKYTSSIQSLISHSKSIKLEGTFKPEEIAQVFSEVDVLVLPSRWFENGPLVLRNSLLGKIPVIATNLGSNPEYINDPLNGLLFENEDENDLANKIEFLIEKPEKIKEMSKKILKQKSIKQDTFNLLYNYQNLLKS